MTTVEPDQANGDQPDRPSLAHDIRALQARAANGDQAAARHLAVIVKRIRAARGVSPS